MSFDTAMKNVGALNYPVSKDLPKEIFENWIFIETINLVNDSGSIEKNWLANVMAVFYNLVRYKWRYIHCDFELMFEINSSPLDYGSFCIGWCPGSIGENFEPLNAHPRFFDISTGGTHIVRYPFSSIFEGYDTRFGPVTSDFKSPVPKFYFQTLHLGTLAATLSSTLNVRGRLVDVKGWGAINLDSNDFPNPEIADEVEFQMATFDLEAAMPVPVRAGIMALDNRRPIAAGAATAFTSFVAWNMRPRTEHPLNLPSKEHSEEGLKNKPDIYGGLTDFGHGSRENLSFSMCSIPPRNLYDWSPKNLLDIMKIRCFLVANDFAALGANIVIPVNPNLSDASVPRPIGSRKVTYLQQFASLFRFWRGSLDFTLAFHTSPMITAVFQITIGTFGGEIGTPVPDPAGTNNWFLYKRVVKVTGFTTEHIRVPYMAPFAWSPIYGVEQNGASFTGVNPSYMHIRLLSITSGLAGSGAVPHVYLNTFVKGGDDFQVRNLAGQSYQTVVVPEEDEVELQMFTVFDDQVEYKNICEGHEPIKLRETAEDMLDIDIITQRWSFYAFNVSGNQKPSEPRIGNGWYNDRPYLDLFYYIMGMFRYVHGNIDYKIRLRENIGTARIVMQPSQSFLTPSGSTSYEARNSSMGIASTYTPLNPVIEFEAPCETYTDWMLVGSAYEASSTQPTPLQWHIEPNVSTDNLETYVRAGTGFNLAFLQAPLAQRNYLPLWANA